MGLRIDHLQIIRRIFGERYWVRSRFEWIKTDPSPFDVMPLRFENAFGGSHYDSEGKLLDCFAANPVGKGYSQASAKAPQEGQALPNIEFRHQLIERWADKPQPAALGFVAHDWQPRAVYQGTYDEAWQQNRAPLLPEDFDDRFFNAAPSDLQIPYLRGGEQIALAGLTPNGYLTFQIPRWEIKACIVTKGRAYDLDPVLDTLVIEPDKMQAQLTWRVSVKCFNQFLFLDKVIVSVKDNSL